MLEPRRAGTDYPFTADRGGIPFRGSGHVMPATTATT